MALLNRLFPSRKKQSAQKGYVSPPAGSPNQKPFEFTRDQVRVLLFRECEKRGRKLLFDSKAVKKVSLPTASKHVKINKTQVVKRMETSFVEITNGYGYQYTRPAADVKYLGEMIFGSVAMTLRGSTFKIHTGGTPPFLMITRVTNSPGKKLSDYNLEDSCGSSISSMNEYVANPSSSSDSKLSHSSGSYPLDVPLSSSLTLGASQFFSCNDTKSDMLESSCSLHRSSLEGDSGCYTSSDSSVNGLLISGSLSTFVAGPNSRKGSGGSLSSLRQRWLRTASTSLDLGSSQSLTKTDSLISTNSLQQSTDEKALHHTKLGIALIINLTLHQKKIMQDFFLEHGMLLESISVRLQAAVERAYCRKEHFVSMMVDASYDVEQSIEDVILGPRLCSPVWLSLITGGAQCQQNFASNFLQEMCQMIDMFDTKDSNFFLSSLLTAVLTHHLGWVSTVVPGLARKNGEGLLTKLSELHKTYPYNPFWAQAMDLYGALGNPMKTARTIVTSLTFNKNRHEIIEKLLRVVSYFIRCNSIQNKDPVFKDIDFSSSLSAQDSSDSLNSSDRAASSSTLQPFSGELSSLQTIFQIAPPVLPNTLDRPFIIDNASKSENALNSAIEVDNGLKQPIRPSGKGLRRTMSYSCRLSSSANKHSSNSNLGNSLLHHRDASRQNQDQDFNQTETTIADKDTVSSVGKVIFVLGENDNLIGLKRNKKNLKNETNKAERNGLGLGKAQDQPLSFSGSEVESGFSDCESFELSPVRSVSESFLCSLNHKNKSIYCSEQRSHSKIVCSDQENSVIGFELCKSTQVPESNIIHQAVTAQSALINIKNNSNSPSSDVTNLCSLARSLSVNLPISVKSRKEENNFSLFCEECSRQVSEGCTKHFKEPVKAAVPKQLTRTSSSANVSHTHHNRLKGIALCSSCCGKDMNSCIAEGDVYEQPQPVSSVPIMCNTVSQEFAKTDKTTTVIELAMPPSSLQPTATAADWAGNWGVADALFGGVSTRYIPDRVLQGCAPLSPGWELALKRDLAIDAQLPTLDAGITESVAIVANIDSWEVQLISSHTYVVDRPGTLGVRVGLSHLVANMLESVCHLWKLQTAPELCLSYLEGRLQELWARSRALSELLLSTEFCDMDLVTSSLCLEPNDVPLLLAVASTHSPEVTQRYGLSFR